MTGKKADIIAVARAAGVSPSTVSRAFNHPDLVKASTRRRIDAAVRRLGYLRNRAAQTIHGIRSGTVGLIVPTVAHAIFAELIQSFSEAIEPRGFTILLASHGYSLDREYALTRKMLEHRVDGVALIGMEHAPETFGLLRQQSAPAVLLWNASHGAPVSCAGADNARAGQLVGAHLAGLGHRAVATVFPPLAGNDRARHRFAGLTDALAEAGIAAPSEWLLQTPYSVADAKDAVGAFLDGGARPTALVCGNDVLAWGALHALAQRGLRAPCDLAVTGIGDFKGSREFEPALTTVRIPAREIGALGAAAMADAIVTPGADPVRHVVAPTLKVRATCGGARPA